MARKLRSGYTTGACAAAASRAACTALLAKKSPTSVPVTFPDGSIVSFAVTLEARSENSARASVVKDAGDDPDVTNGAVIAADVVIEHGQNAAIKIVVTGGTGVGNVTKPGLAVDVGNPAINPVPMQMIRQNVREAYDYHGGRNGCMIRVCISVPEGEELAKKTLNARLGIIGGISILGTTGIVRPVSAKAWTDTILASLDVAQANGITDIVLSTGRTSERCIQKQLDPPEEALVMMGDYLHFSLKAVKQYQFTTIHLATMWAKLLKGAMGHEQTHVRHGVLEMKDVRTFFTGIGIEKKLVDQFEKANTAREILEVLMRKQTISVIEQVCDVARGKYEGITGINTLVHLVDGRGKLICSRGK